MNGYLESLVARAMRTPDPSALRPPPSLSVLPPVPREIAPVIWRRPESQDPASGEVGVIAPLPRWDGSRSVVERGAVGPPPGREPDTSMSAQPDPIRQPTAPVLRDRDRGRAHGVQDKPPGRSVAGTWADGAEATRVANPPSPASSVRPGPVPPRRTLPRTDRIAPESVAVAGSEGAASAPRMERATLTARPPGRIGAVPPMMGPARLPVAAGSESPPRLRPPRRDSAPPGPAKAERIPPPVEIIIDRVDIRLSAPAARRAPQPSAPAAHLSLAEYLDRRTRG